MSLVEPSENVPVAIIGRVVASMMLGVAGVTAIATSVALETVKVAVALSPLVDSNAVTVTVPGDTPVAIPCVQVWLEIVAIASFDEDHDTTAVRSELEPSLKVPVAVKYCLVLFG